MERVGRVHFEVGWHRNAVYNVFGATWRGLEGSISRSVASGMQFWCHLEMVGRVQMDDDLVWAGCLVVSGAPVTPGHTGWAPVELGGRTELVSLAAGGGGGVAPAGVGVTTSENCYHQDVLRRRRSFHMQGSRFPRRVGLRPFHHKR